MELLVMSVFLILLSVLKLNMLMPVILGLSIILWFFSIILMQKNLLYLFMLSDWFIDDSMSSLMIMMLTLVVVMSFMCSDKDFCGEVPINSFSFCILFILIVCGLVFSISSFFLFFMFFEGSLIPTLLLILGWGYQPERLQAGLYMMMYMVCASMPMLVILCYLWTLNGTDSMILMSMFNFMSLSSLMWMVLIFGFLVKFPVFLVHGWLPKAHVEAPVSGSMILAGILLKLGGYGLFRFFWMLGFSSYFLSGMIMAFGLWGGLLSSIICMVQSDMKAMIAYSSISHMSLVLGGTMTFFELGWNSSVFMMFAHGVCSPVMFALANCSYSMSGSRSLMLCKGIMKVFPSFTIFWGAFSFLNMGCPPSLNFLAECFLIGSVFFYFSYFSIPLMMMGFFSAGFCMFLYVSLNHGPMSKSLKSLSFMSDRMFLTMIPSFLLLFIGGVALDLMMF